MSEIMMNVNVFRYFSRPIIYIYIYHINKYVFESLDPWCGPIIILSLHILVDIMGVILYLFH